jgi:hypothetical protein
MPERRTAYYPGGHGSSRSCPEIGRRERIGSGRQWFLVFQTDENSCLRRCAGLRARSENPDAWHESDGSAGLRGFFVKSDKYAEAKAILSSMISAGASAFPQTTTLLSPLGGATQINGGGIENAFSRGSRPVDRSTQASSGATDKNPYFVRVPAGATFYLHVTQTIDLGKASVGFSASFVPSSNPKEP